MKQLNLLSAMVMVLVLSLSGMHVTYAKGDPPKSLSGGFTSKGTSDKPPAKSAAATAKPIESVKAVPKGNESAGRPGAAAFGAFKSGANQDGSTGPGVVAGAQPKSMAADLKTAADREQALKTLAQRRVAGAATAAVITAPIAIGAAAAIHSNQAASASGSAGPAHGETLERNDYARGYRQATRDAVPQALPPPIVVYRDRSWGGPIATATDGYLAGGTVEGTRSRIEVDHGDGESVQTAAAPTTSAEVAPTTPMANIGPAVGGTSLAWMWLVLVPALCGVVWWMLIRARKPQSAMPKRYAL